MAPSSPRTRSRTPRGARIGVYPGSFNPATIAHFAIADAARRQCRLERVDLVISQVTLGKQPSLQPSAEQRAATLRELAHTRSWLGVRVTDARLLVDIAQGYDVLVLGADKWSQVVDPAWYGSESARDEVLTRLPELAIAPRAPHPVPPHATLLHVPDADGVSSTGVREHGRDDWLAR